MEMDQRIRNPLNRYMTEVEILFNVHVKEARCFFFSPRVVDIVSRYLSAVFQN